MGLTKLLSDLPKGSGVGRLDDKWIELMDYTDEIIEYLGEMSHDMEVSLGNIREVIDGLPARERMIIVGRHVRGLPFRDILKELHCSERNMYQLYRDALEMIPVPLQDNVQDNASVTGM